MFHLALLFQPIISLLSLPLTYLFFKSLLEPSLPGRFLECVMGESVYSTLHGSVLCSFFFPPIPVRHLSSPSSPQRIPPEVLTFLFFLELGVLFSLSPLYMFTHTCVFHFKRKILGGGYTDLYNKERKTTLENVQRILRK